LDEAQLRPSDFDAASWALGTWGTVTWANQEDTRLRDRLWEVVKPGVERPRANESHHRDVIALHTAIGYQRDGFVTRDSQMLKKAQAVREAFGGFLLMDPEGCVDVVETRIATYRQIAGL
jgi:hypothetical protein